VSAAVVIPFPVARRRAYIARQASHAALMNPDAGTRYLEHQIEIQAQAMRRKGVSEDLIEREVRCMKSAIAAAFCPTCSSPGW
jgi:hypothetical protein